MTLPRTISIFGATGSVGQSTLDLIRHNRDAWRVVALTAYGDVAGLAALAKEFDAEVAVIGDPLREADLAAALIGTKVQVGAGEQALIDSARIGADMTVAAIVGCAGLGPTMAAIEAGKSIALANKESLVSSGELMMAAAQAHGTTLLPIDSEHNAIFQCLAGGRIDDVRGITLTASGGPFRRYTLDQMRHVTPEQAVAHPNWSMGAKISVDSATLMNKGLELIEAHHLFPVGHEKINILVHPQSVIHSLVEFVDRSTLAQLGSPDMRIPIASALAWPVRMETPCAPLDLATIGSLEFEAPDPVRFPALRLTRQVIEEGGARPAQLNAANEIAVAAFLQKRIGFLDIATIVEAVLDSYRPATPTGLADIYATDAEARRIATMMVERKAA